MEYSLEDTYKNFMDMGERLGYKGRELEEWVEKKWLNIVKNREEEKEKERREKEKEKEKEREEKEKEREEKEKEREEKEKEREFRERELVMQLQIIEKQAEVRNNEVTGNTVTNVNGELDETRREDRGLLNAMARFQFQIYDDKSCDIDTFMKKFEREMNNYKFPEEKWLGILGRCFKGEIPSKICLEKTDYRQAKAQLLIHFGSTEANYRKKFFDISLSQESDPKDYFDMLSNAMDKWLECAKVGETVEDLKNFFIMDRAVHSFDVGLKAFIQERVPKTIEEIVKLIRNYKLAHPKASVYSKDTAQEIVCFSRGREEKNQLGGIKFRSKSQDGRGNNACFICGKTNHWARDCRNRVQRKMYCYICKSQSHNERDCRQKRANFIDRGSWNGGKGKARNEDRKYQNNDNKRKENCIAIVSGKQGIQLFPGFANDIPVKTLRDSGSTILGLKSEFVKKNQYTGEFGKCLSFDGRCISLPKAYVDIDTPFLKGKVLVHAIPRSPIDLIIGNVEGVKDCTLEEIEEWKEKKCKGGKDRGVKDCIDNVIVNNDEESGNKEFVNQINDEHEDGKIQEKVEEVVDRNEKEMEGVGFNSIKIDAMTLAKEQREDPLLQGLFKAAKKENKSEGRAQFHIKNDTEILTRVVHSEGKIVEQVVIPSKYKEMILEQAHSIPLAGHMGVSKTKHRILISYFWPNLVKDVRKKVKECKVCQLKGSKGNNTKAPLQVGVAAQRPFAKVAIDLVGPLPIMSARGHRYILTMVDICSRWVEAIPLKRIEAKDIAQALFIIFTRIGFPDEVISDRGTQFTSSLTKQFLEMFKVRQKFTTPYHPQCNGMCERFNKTLKESLSKISDDKPKDWDLVIPSILFSYRETKHESTGFSPFQLVYGANPRGPMAIFKDLVDSGEKEKDRSTYEIVTETRENIIKACEEANKNTGIKQMLGYDRINKNRKLRVLRPDDLVLVLLPNKENKFFTQWLGPYKVNRQINEVDYEVMVKDKPKVYHIDMLKQYFEKPVEVIEEKEGNSGICCGILVEEGEEEDIKSIETVEIKKKQSWTEVDLTKLPEEKAVEVRKVMKEYEEIFSDLPGKTRVIEHDIVLTDDKPIRMKQYPVPIHFEKDLKKELDELLGMGLIEHSDSAYASPMVLIRKKDKSIRLCVDYRQLNKITQFDSYPMGNMEIMFSRLANAKIFTKLDMAKGYYQISLTERCRPFTSFVTPFGLFQWNVMSFGLVNAPATFNRMMGKLFGHREDVIFYLDDICIFSNSWEEHFKSLREIFQILKDNNLTIKPAKIEIGLEEVTFLGHKITNNSIKPLEETVSKILKIKVPKTKKEVRSLLGLCNFYRKFIPQFANITEPLTRLIRKGEPNKIKWSSEGDRALQKIQSVFSSKPILKIPDVNKPFVVCTDASNTAISGCLLQEYDGILHPVLYISRLLKNGELRYAIVEKEALAVIFTITKLDKYLLGVHFILCTDHAPLACITSKKLKNSRIDRWSLILQDYNFTVKTIPGKQNIMADCLSRCT